jgi:hypothetical protein
MRTDLTVVKPNAVVVFDSDGGFVAGGGRIDLRLEPINLIRG